MDFADLHDTPGRMQEKGVIAVSGSDGGRGGGSDGGREGEATYACGRRLSVNDDNMITVEL